MLKIATNTDDATTRENVKTKEVYSQVKVAVNSVHKGENETMDEKQAEKDLKDAGIFIPAKDDLFFTNDVI